MTTRTRKTLSSAILTTIACGLLAFFAEVVRDISNVKARVSNMEKTETKIEKQIDAIYWHLIVRPGVSVPKSKAND